MWGRSWTRNELFVFCEMCEVGQVSASAFGLSLARLPRRKTNWSWCASCTLIRAQRGGEARKERVLLPDVFVRGPLQLLDFCLVRLVNLHLKGRALW